ncbi:MAG: histidine phosphatase family protein [Ruminococcaceae bacterium]|nr:histidine phosphatase family protein [Oscillospiraceae bacterium]
MLLYYIRHGEPLNVPDHSLTPLGRAQAEALAKRLCLFGLDRVFASPTLRTMQTAKPICELLGKEITVCNWADEGIVWEEFTVPHEKYGKTWVFFDPDYLEIFSSPEVRALGERWYQHPALSNPKFESGIKRVNAAVDEFFLSLGYRHDRENARYEVVTPNNDRVALFAHQGFGMSFFSSMLDIPYPTFATHFDFSHSSMSMINFEMRGKYVYPHVLQVANDSHLYREGILTGYHNQIKF